MKLGDIGTVTVDHHSTKAKLVAFGLNTSGELTFTLESLTIGYTFTVSFEHMKSWKRERPRRRRVAR